MKAFFKFDSKIHDSHYMTTHRRNRNRLLFLLIVLLAVGGYFVVPKIIKSIPKTKPEPAAKAELEPAAKAEPAAEEKIIKTLPLPDIESLRTTQHQAQ